MRGITLMEQNNNIQYEPDTVLNASNDHDLHKLLHAVIIHNKHFRILLNYERT